MASKGADYGWYRSTFQNKSKQTALATTDSGTIDSVVAVPRVTANANFIQRIVFNVTTDSAQTLTFQDGAGTPVVIGKSPASPGLGATVVADFGPEGTQLTAGEELDMVISGAGLAGVISIEAYEKQVTVVAVASA